MGVGVGGDDLEGVRSDRSFDPEGESGGAYRCGGKEGHALFIFVVVEQTDGSELGELFEVT